MNSWNKRAGATALPLSPRSPRAATNNHPSLSPRTPGLSRRDPAPRAGDDDESRIGVAPIIFDAKNDRPPVAAIAAGARDANHAEYLAAHESPVPRPAARRRSRQSYTLPSKGLCRISFLGRIRTTWSLSPACRRHRPAPLGGFVFLGLGCSESGSNHRALHAQETLESDSRQRGRGAACLAMNVCYEHRAMR